MAEETGRKITIDGKDYLVDEMSEEARNILNNIQMTDQELTRLRAQIAITQTARQAFGSALRQALGTEPKAEASESAES